MFEVDIHGATLRLPTETGAPYFLQLTFCGGKLIGSTAIEVRIQQCQGYVVVDGV